MPSPRARKGFTLIELLIVVAIIGIIAAIAIPNLMAAIQRAKQKRTMSDMRALGLSLQVYNTDYGGFPGVGYDEIEKCVSYLGKDPFNPSPWRDGWRWRLLWDPDITRPLPWGGWGNYKVWSFGSNKKQDGFVATPTTKYFDCDIIYEDGTFLQSPEGSQKK